MESTPLVSEIVPDLLPALGLVSMSSELEITVVP